MWANFHTHSKYCDGKGELMDYVEEARRLKICSLGFSSHAPVEFNCGWCMKADDLDHYLQSIDTLKKSVTDIELYKSLEIDYIPRTISTDQFKNQLDYTIGSIHFIDSFPEDGIPWEIDGKHTRFLEGLDKIFHGDSTAAFSRYFELTRKMIEESCPTIIGHLDKIKIQNVDNKFFSEDDEWYQREVRKTVDLIAERKAIVEVNTRGVYQKKSSTVYPSPWILKLLYEKDIPITLSSDAHHPADLINQFTETVHLLSDIGFKKISILHEGGWKPFSFNAHGVIK